MSDNKNYGYTFGDGRVITNLLEGKTISCADHVSKKALREWCEKIKYRLYTSNSLGTAIAKGATETAQGIIDQFCKEGE